VSFETAKFLRRQAERAEVHLRLAVDGESRTVEARNVVAEIPGSDPDAGWLIACAHYDGHDVAQGAQDNATGTAVVLEVARALAPFRAHLKAGLRFCFFSGEEMGLHGSKAYVRAHSGELDQVRAVLNADVVGLASPLVLSVQNSPELSTCLGGPVIAGMEVLVEDRMVTAYSDHYPFVLAGVPACAVHTAAPAGGGWAHTAADTLDKLDLGELREAAGAVGRILLRMAVAPESLPSRRQPRDAVRQALVDAELEDSLRVQRSWPF
jgi:Zn-dependent M28 family amino/carboxypeptidase